MMEERILAAFEPLRKRLQEITQRGSPSGSNLHFHSLDFTDASLFQEIVALARDGRDAVNKHREYFLSASLYDDGMFWYYLFLVIGATALRVRGDGKQETIPKEALGQLAGALIEMAEYSTVRPGDIAKRNWEALGNLAYCFQSDELASLIGDRAKATRLKRVESLATRSLGAAKAAAQRNMSEGGGILSNCDR